MDGQSRVEFAANRSMLGRIFTVLDANQYTYLIWHVWVLPGFRGSGLLDLVRVTFECESCGGAVLKTDDHPTNDSVVCCKGCGWVYGTFRDLKRNAVQDVVSVALARATQRIHKRRGKFH